MSHPSLKAISADRVLYGFILLFWGIQSQLQWSPHDGWSDNLLNVTRPIQTSLHPQLLQMPSNDLGFIRKSLDLCWVRFHVAGLWTFILSNFYLKCPCLSKNRIWCGKFAKFQPHLDKSTLFEIFFPVVI